MFQLKNVLLITTIAIGFTACKKDKDPIIIVPPSSGAQVQLNGIAGSEPGGAARNAVYLDLSADKATAVDRMSWDLGFYSGSDFRVVLNNTTSAGAIVLAKNDLTTVGEADTIGLTLSTDQFNPLPIQLSYFDDIAGNITGTVIPAVSTTDAANNVIILNRGTGGSIPARAWIKLRVLRNTSGGYTLQYAGIKETTFKTIQVPKDAAYHFTFVSVENGIVPIQPEKERWDLVWGYSVFETDFGGGSVPYNFSDLIAVNNLSNVQVKEMKYADAATALAAYNVFNMDSVNKSVNAVVTGRWTIGSGWRSTQPATGARLEKFYIIKDPAGNYYKFKCLAMGVGGDGGTRGKPEFKYELIK